MFLLKYARGCSCHGEIKDKPSRDARNQHNKGLVPVFLGHGAVLGQSCGLPNWRKTVHRCMEGKVDSPSSGATVEAGETFSLDHASSGAVTLPVELWLFFSASLRLSSGKRLKTSLVCFLLPLDQAHLCLLKEQHQIRVT